MGSDAWPASGVAVARRAFEATARDVRITAARVTFAHRRLYVPLHVAAEVAPVTVRAAAVAVHARATVREPHAVPAAQPRYAPVQLHGHATRPTSAQLARNELSPASGAALSRPHRAGRPGGTREVHYRFARESQRRNPHPPTSSAARACP